MMNINPRTGGLWMLLVSATLAWGNVDNNPPVKPDASSSSTNPPTECRSDPINVLNGAVLIEEHDLRLPAPVMDLEFRRAWQSSFHEAPAIPDSTWYAQTGIANTTATGIGGGWMHEYEWKIINLGDRVIQDVPGTYMRLDALVSPCAGRYRGGTFFYRQVEVAGGEAPGGGTPVRMFVTHGHLDHGILYQFASGSWRLASLPGDARTYEFGPDGRMTRIDHPAGARITLQYQNNRLIQAVHNSGAYLNFEYENDRLVRVRTPNPDYGMEFSFPVDEAVHHPYQMHRVIRKTPGGDEIFDYEYRVKPNQFGQNARLVIVQRTPPSGDRFIWAYSHTTETGLRGIAGHVESGGGTYHRADLLYDHVIDDRHYTHVMMHREDETVSEFFSHDLEVPALILGPVPGAREFRGYDVTRNLISHEMAFNGDTLKAKFQYDDARNPISAAVGYNDTPVNVTTLTWHPQWRLPTSVRDALDRGVATDYENALPVRVRAVSGVQELFQGGIAYAAGLPIRVTNANERVTSMEYDVRGHLAAVIPPAGPRLDLDHDELGRLLRLRQPGPAGERITAFRPDHAGRPLAVTNAVGQVATFVYDWAGRLTHATDFAGRSVTNTWRLGKLVSTTRGPATVSFDHDPQMDTLAVRDPLNRVVERYALDAAGRATSVTNIDERVMSVAYGVGGLVTGIDRFDGTAVSHTYDRHARLTGTDYPDAALRYAYLANGLLSAVTNGADRVELDYDLWNRPVGVTSIVNGHTNAVAYAYDPAGNLTNRVSAAGTTSHAYDDAERLVAIQGPDETVAYAYNPWTGLVETETRGGGLTVAHAHDDLDRVTDIEYRNAASNLVYGVSYVYDAAGMITQKVSRTASATNTVAYVYDVLDRLVREDDGAMAREYDYDLAGNRTAQRVIAGGVTNLTSYVLGTGDRLASWGSQGAAQYDIAGCVTNLVRETAPAVTLQWDGQYRVTAAQVSTNTVSYSYDPLGRRVSRTENAQTERYIHDGAHIITDTDDAGTLLRTYTHGPGMDNLLAMTVYGGVTNTYYYVKDHLNSTVALVDDTGAVVESYAYDAFGDVSFFDGTGSPIAGSAYGNRFLFQGREYDATTGLYNFRARWYDSETGRWLSNDPIGISGGLNQYVFCANNPVNMTDRFGLCENSRGDKNDSYIFDGNPVHGLLFDPTLGFYYTALVLIIVPEPGTTAAGLLSLAHGLLTDLAFDNGQLDGNLLPDGYYGNLFNRLRNGAEYLRNVAQRISDPLNRIRDAFIQDASDRGYDLTDSGQVYDYWYDNFTRE
jgi:RHS repeat-associated protein